MRSAGTCWSLIGQFAGDVGFEDFRAKKRGGVYLVEVAIDEDEVGIVSGKQLTLVFFREFRVGRASSVGVESLAAGQLVFAVVGFGAGFVHSRDCGVEAAKRCDWLNGVVCAEGHAHARIEEGLPRIGVGGSFGPETFFGPVHVSEQMIGLHARDNAELLEAWDVRLVDDLGMLDAIAGSV